MFDQTNYTIDNKKLFVFYVPPACSNIYEVIIKRYIQWHTSEANSVGGVHLQI